LGELREFQQQVKALNHAHDEGVDSLPILYTILGSSVPGVFNLGGDLQLFSRLIRDGDRDGLFHYAKSCIDVLYPNAVNFQMPLTTITLVQGDALGGGFEAAISSNVVIAEESAKFGLPEVLFNLVPGMGAYSFLVRRTGPDLAEKIIMSGELLTARKMQNLGLVDEVVEDGKGEEAVERFIQRHRKRGNAHEAMSRIKKCINPVTYEELIDITRIWVEAALRLTSRDLRMIERLVQAQNRRTGLQGAQPKALEGLG
jgi:DSF synthase